MGRGFCNFISPWNWNCNRKFYVLVAITSWYNSNTWSREMSSIKKHICFGYTAFKHKDSFKSQWIIWFSLTFDSLLCQVGANNGLDGVLTMVATPSVFFNECEISFKFDWRSEAELPSDINVQVKLYFSRTWTQHPVSVMMICVCHDDLCLSWWSVSGGGGISCVCDGVMG